MADDTVVSDELATSIAKYETAKTEVSKIVEGLSEDQLNWRSDEGAWSILECLEHLNQVGNEMLPVMRREMEKGRAAGKTGSGPFKYSWLGRKFASAAGPLDSNNTFKGKSPRLYIPSSNLSGDIVVSTFMQLQDEFIATTKEAQGLHLKKIRVTSPAIAVVRFSLGVWLGMLPAHQLRHIQQAQRVRDALPTE